MRICLDIRYTTRGGASSFINGFTRSLFAVPHPHTIDFVTHRDRTFAPPALSGNRLDVPFRNRWLEFQWSQTVLPRHLKRRGFDVYHSLKHVGPVHCPVRSVYRVPAVGQFVGQYPQSRADQAYWGYVARHVYRRADLLIAVSDYVRRGLIEYLELPECRIARVYNGVDTRFGPRRYDQPSLARLKKMGIDRPFMLSVANLVPVKNLPLALRAVKALDRSDLQLVLAGQQRTPHGRQLHELALELGIADRVVFVGRRSFEDLLLLYNRAEMLVHCSIHEGFSGALLEAMACGLPIVAANSTSIPETVGDAAIYHAPHDAEGLADGICLMLGDSDLRHELSQRAIRRARQFSWHRCLRQTLAAYERLS